MAGTVFALGGRWIGCGLRPIRAWGVFQGFRYAYPSACSSAMRTTPPRSAIPNPGSRSFSVTFCVHAVAAGLRRQPGLGELAEATRDIRIRRRGVERLERRTVHHELDGHFVRAAHALEMIPDVAQYERNLVKVAEVVHDLRLIGIGCVRGARVAAASTAPAAVKAPMMILRRCIGFSIGPAKRRRRSFTCAAWRRVRHPSSAASRAALRLCSRMTGAMSRVTISPSSTIRRPPTTSMARAGRCAEHDSRDRIAQAAGTGRCRA